MRPPSVSCAKESSYPAPAIRTAPVLKIQKGTRSAAPKISELHVGSNSLAIQSQTVGIGFVSSAHQRAAGRRCSFAGRRCPFAGRRCTLSPSHRAGSSWGGGRGAAGCRRCSSLCRRPNPTKLPAIISPFLGDQLSGQGSTAERIPLLEAVRFSATLLPLGRYRRVVKYASGFLACLSPGVAGPCGWCMRRGRSPAIAKDVPRRACSFLFPLLSAVSFPNSFLFFLRFAVQIKDSQARRWQGKLILV